MQAFALDFGSTTSSALIAKAPLLKNSINGRMERGELEVLYRSEPIFTPFIEEKIDPSLLLNLGEWFSHLDPDPELLTRGGVIITGLAALKENALEITKEIRRRYPETLVGLAGNPAYESWVSFMGNCLELSLKEPEQMFLNFDIGGGTSNIALGQKGELLSQGCLWVGARHFQFQPGTYLITKLSPHGKKLLEYLKISKKEGQELYPQEIESVLNFYIRTLENFDPPLFLRDGDFGFSDFKIKKEFKLTFSGGVGELIYSFILGQPWPPTTFYGDFGIDLAQKILQSPLLSRNLKTHLPKHLGRATLYGLVLGSTEISGSTVYLSPLAHLPCLDVPILGEIESALDLAQKSQTAAAFTISAHLKNLSEIKSFVDRIKNSLLTLRSPIVLFVPKNIGKTLGNYLNDWGNSALNLIVIDELEVNPKKAQFVSLGAVKNGVIPVSLYTNPH